MKYLFLLSIIIVCVWMVADMFLRPGVDDLKGNFKELAFTRNEQNTGPVSRIYVISVSDTLWGNMLKFGNYMPHNKYGTTRVFFFLENTPAPDKLYFGQENLSPVFKKYCIARYEKNSMSHVSFMRYPFVMINAKKE